MPFSYLTLVMLVWLALPVSQPKWLWAAFAAVLVLLELGMLFRIALIADEDSVGYRGAWSLRISIPRGSGVALTRDSEGVYLVDRGVRSRRLPLLWSAAELKTFCEAAGIDWLLS